MERHALSRLTRFMKVYKRRIIMKALKESQFGYCLLVLDVP